MSIYNAALGACANMCPAPHFLMMAMPLSCDAKIIATDSVVVGFLMCDVSDISMPALPPNPMLSDLQALVSIGKLLFKKVQNFNKAPEEWQELSFDPFIPPVITGANQTMTFEDNYFEISSRSDVSFWNDIVMFASKGKLNLVTIYRGDLVTFYRTPISLKQTLTYDATGKNIARRQFTVSFTWSDSEGRGWNYYLIPGAYNAFSMN